MNLYNLNKDYSEIKSLIEDGEISLDDAKDTLEGIELGVKEKIDQYAMWRADTAGDIGKVDAEIKRLQDIKSSYGKTKSFIEDQLRYTMSNTGITKAKGVFSVSLGKPSVSTVITDEKLIPDDYIVVSRHVSKADLGKALKSGENIPGAELKEGNARLTIR